MPTSAVSAVTATAAIALRERLTASPGVWDTGDLCCARSVVGARRIGNGSRGHVACQGLPPRCRPPSATRAGLVPEKGPAGLLPRYGRPERGRWRTPRHGSVTPTAPSASPTGWIQAISLVLSQGVKKGFPADPGVGSGRGARSAGFAWTCTADGPPSARDAIAVAAQGRGGFPAPESGRSAVKEKSRQSGWRPRTGAAFLSRKRRVRPVFMVPSCAKHPAPVVAAATSHTSRPFRAGLDPYRSLDRSRFAEQPLATLSGNVVILLKLVLAEPSILPASSCDWTSHPWHIRRIRRVTPLDVPSSQPAPLFWQGSVSAPCSRDEFRR